MKIASQVNGLHPGGAILLVGRNSYLYLLHYHIIVKA